MVVVYSRTVEVLDEHELRTVLGPRGRPHPLRPRALPHRADDPAVGDAAWAGCRCSPGLPLLAVKLALLEWFRAAELSCDRAATLVNRDPLVTCRTLMVIAGGTASRKLDLDAFIRQAAAYEEWEPGWDKLARVRIELGQTHAFPVKRVSELMKWVRSGEYDRIVAGRVRPPRRPASTRAPRPATRSSSTPSASARSSATPAPASRRRASRSATAAERLSEWLPLTAAARLTQRARTRRRARDRRRR